MGALAILGVTADQALAFEDSPAGVHAAKQAQIRCVAVPNDVTRLATFNEADAVLTSLRESSLDGILRIVAS